MYREHPSPTPPAIVVSDLDGTLLDHTDYSFDAALPALRLLRERGIPLILATSKTLAEAVEINRALDNREAMIVENGGAICVPQDVDYPIDRVRHETLHDHTIVRLAPPHSVVRYFITQQRSRHGWSLRGFSDMTVSEVAEITGLDELAAQRAKQRLCGEPFLWMDGRAAFQRFHMTARYEGFKITQGGRFHHLMGGSDKAHALHAVRLMMAADSDAGPVIALGDSNNDKAMLEAADIAVVIKRHDGSHLDCRGISKTLYTVHAGPRGWNAAILQVLDHLPALPPKN